MLVRQGFYALVLPGALLGLGCGSLSGRHSKRLGVGGAVAALFLGLFVDWRFVSFMADNSLGYFFAHLQDFRDVTQIRVLLGAALVFSFGRGRPGGTWLRKKGIS